MTAFICDVLIADAADVRVLKGLELNYFIQAKNVFECFQLKSILSRLKELMNGS